MKMVVGALAAASILFAAGTSSAAPVLDFDIAGAPGSSVSANLGARLCFGCNVTTTLSSTLDGQIFSLAEGESRTFDFFTIKVGGLGAAAVNVMATLAFDLPSGVSIGGTGIGGYATIFGVVTAGSLTWTDPAPFELSNGSRFSVEFSDILGVGLADGATVTATVTALSVAPSAVPEPASVAVIASGLLGLGAVAVRRRKAA